MVRARRLIPVESPLMDKIREYSAKLGARALPFPKSDAEFVEFEDLYFKLKEMINFRRDPKDVANSLSDLSSICWAIQNKKIELNTNNVFVTLNHSILENKEILEKSFKSLKVMSLSELSKFIEERKSKQPAGGKT